METRDTQVTPPSEVGIADTSLQVPHEALPAQPDADTVIRLTEDQIRAREDFLSGFVRRRKTFLKHHALPSQIGRHMMGMSGAAAVATTVFS
jgi:hypothetical protein